MAPLSELFFISAAMLTAINAQTTDSPGIRLPPSITNGPNQIYFYKDGETVNLLCEGIGMPAPDYAWMKNGLPLSMTGIVQDPTTGTIQIGVTKIEHEGDYQCFVSSTYGKTMSNVVQLRLASLGSFDANAPKLNVTVAANDKLRLVCGPPASIPSATFSWSYNTTSLAQTDLVLSKRVQVDFNGDLCFASVDANEPSNRLYRCNVNNYVISSQNSGAYTRIGIAGTPVNNVAPALFFSSPPTVYALTSQQTILRCFFSGTDNNGQGTITYQWTYNGQNGLPTGWVFMDSEVRSPATGTAMTDAGIYQCYGTNTLGQANATIELIVESIPDFGAPENAPQDRNVTEGDVVTISCLVDAVPAATIRWFKNAEEFDASTLPPKFQLSEDLMTLTISDVCKDCPDGTTDLMNVQCNATNSHGYSFAQGYVNVLLAPTISSESVSVPFAPFKIYQFDCAATCDPSTTCTADWTFKGQAVVVEDFRLYVDDQNSLHIDTSNDTDGGTSRIGTYTCTVSDSVSETSINATIDGEVILTPAELWWVGLLVALLVLLLLLLVLCCIFFCFCRDGKSYPVDKQERKNGNVPEEDLKKMALYEFFPNKSISTDPLPVYPVDPSPPQPQVEKVYFTGVGDPVINTNYVEDPVNNAYVPTSHIVLQAQPRPRVTKEYLFSPGTPPAVDAHYVRDPAAGVYFQAPTQLPYLSQPQPTTPPVTPFYVQVNGGQGRPLSHTSQGEVFTQEHDNAWRPYDGIPQSEV